MLRHALLIILGLFAVVGMWIDKDRGVQWLILVLLIAHMMEAK